MKVLADRTGLELGGACFAVLHRSLTHCFTSLLINHESPEKTRVCQKVCQRSISPTAIPPVFGGLPARQQALFGRAEIPISYNKNGAFYAPTRPRRLRDEHNLLEHKRAAENYRQNNG